MENLAQIGELKPHKATREEIARPMAAAQRNLADARLRGISPETRFDVAYKAAMQCALAALMANGFRPSTNEPGHHATVIQSLPKTIGLPGERMIVLDQLRKKRNLSDYTGVEIKTADGKRRAGSGEQSCCLTAVRRLEFTATYCFYLLSCLHRSCLPKRVEPLMFLLCCFPPGSRR